MGSYRSRAQQQEREGFVWSEAHLADAPPQWRNPENRAFWPHRGMWRWWKRQEIGGFPGEPGTALASGRGNAIAFLRLMEQKTGSDVADYIEGKGAYADPRKRADDLPLQMPIWHDRQTIEGACLSLIIEAKEHGLDSLTKRSLDPWRFLRRLVLAKNPEHYPIVRDLFGPGEHLEAEDRAAVEAEGQR